MKVELIKTNLIPDDGTIIVPFFGRELHVWRQGDTYRAAANTCLHFGGPLECKEGKLVCPWHGATFSLETGERKSGPAPKNARLMFLSTRVEGDALHYVWGE